MVSLFERTAKAVCFYEFLWVTMGYYVIFYTHRNSY